MTDDENPYDESERKTRERFYRREAQAKTYVASAEGRAVCETLLPELAKFMFSEDAPSPPGDLRVAMCEIPELARGELALVALTPLLHGIAVGPEDQRYKEEKLSQEMLLKLAMGEALQDKLFTKGLLKEKWTRRDHDRIMRSRDRHYTAGRYKEKYREYHEGCGSACGNVLDVDARIRTALGPHADARLRGDARGRDGGIREELAAGVAPMTNHHGEPAPLVRFGGNGDNS